MESFRCISTETDNRHSPHLSAGLLAESRIRFYDWKDQQSLPSRKKGRDRASQGQAKFFKHLIFRVLRGGIGAGSCGDVDCRSKCMGFCTPVRVDKQVKDTVRVPVPPVGIPHQADPSGSISPGGFENPGLPAIIGIQPPELPAVEDERPFDTALAINPDAGCTDQNRGIL
jgi:hypothetical protein